MHSEHPDYYDLNLALLKKNQPQIWKQITDSPPEPVGNIFFTPDGKPNITVTNDQNKKVTLHNKTHPQIETEDFLKRVPEDHKGFVAIIGMGLGYAGLEILKNRQHLQRLAIFELDPGIFIQALRYVDLSPILNDSRLILRIGSEPKISKALENAARTIQLEDTNIFHHLPSFKLNPSGYEQLKSDLFTHLNSLNVDGATTRLLGKDFVNNRFQHIATIHHHFLLEQLQNKFKGIPAIMVAGGPSLDKNIHFLAQVQEKAVIIAVDTVLPTLLKHGIRPHFLTCIDPNNLTYEKFADVVPVSKDISLICSSWVNTRTAKNFPALQTFWTFTAKPIEAWLNSLLGGELLTGGASTVAHLNLISAHILGCDPIVFMGQDLAFSAGPATHATGTVLHGHAKTGVISGNPEGQTVEGIDGKTLRTNRSYLSMKEHFESNISQSDRTFINATYSGAHIKGTKVMTIQEVIAQYCRVQVDTTRYIKELCDALKPIDSKKIVSEFTKKIDRIAVVTKNMKKADTLCRSVLKELSKKNRTPVKSFSMLPLQQQKQINNIDVLHKNLDNALDIWKNLEEITMDGLKKSERQKQDISMLENDPSKYSKWLINNLHRLLDINETRRETLDIFLNNLNMIIAFHLKESKNFNDNNRLELARLYMETENYNLARPIIETLHQENPESAEINFFCGCVAALFSEHQAAEQFFETAIGYDPDYVQRINDHRQKLGDEFLGFAQYFKTRPIDRHASVKYVLRKGLKFCHDHHKLLNELETALKRDLEQIKSSLDTKNIEDAAPLIKEWHENIMDQTYLAENLPSEMVGQIFANMGRLHIEKGDPSEALTHFKQAMEYSPLDHHLHIMTIETLFTSGDFTSAIEALNKATQIDNQFGAYWEIIGDNLKDDNQPEEAIIAYEKCFTCLPENTNLLRKIGDCYMASGQLEAAKAAYEQLKLKLAAQNNTDDE